MAKEDINLERVEQVSDFVLTRKAMYEQELSSSTSEIEQFVWSEMIGLLDQISTMLGVE
jgi:hypothetical protein